jgi:hypothetical protein
MEGDSQNYRKQEEEAQQQSPSEPAVLKRIQGLGTEYDHLREKEQEMLELLHRLQQEEESLVAGISQVEPVLVQTTMPKPKALTRKKQGLQRLEQALMQGLDSSSSSSEEG